MNFSEFLSSQKKFPCFITLQALPRAEKTDFPFWQEPQQLWKMRLKSPAEKGRANEEIARFFRKSFSLSVRIVSGKTERKKLLRLDPIVPV